MSRYTTIIIDVISKISITLIYERKGIRLQFRNLLSIRLHYVTAYIYLQVIHYVSRQREANIKKLSGCNKRVFFSVLQLYAPWKSFIERYGVIGWQSMAFSCCVVTISLDLENLYWGHANSQQTVPNPQQVSKIKSLQLIDKCSQGKSAKPIRNFGIRIGSEDWLFVVDQYVYLCFAFFNYWYLLADFGSLMDDKQH